MPESPGPARQLRRGARLRAGDQVAVVAPSWRLDQAALARAGRLLEDWGLRVLVGTNVFDKHPVLAGLAGRDADRAADLQRAWLDPGVSGVLCGRGGYGASRILDYLDWETMASAHPKILLGSSDSTVLHQAFARHLSVTTLFGPLLAASGAVPPASSLDQLHDTLFRPEPGQILTSPGVHTLRSGVGTGIATGGTLTLLAALCGSPAQQAAAGCVVFLEDVDERPYRIDRMLTQLLRAGWFTGAAAIVTGPWADCGPVADIDQIILDRLGPLDVPILAGLEFGHSACPATIPFGVTARVDTTSGTVEFATAALK